MSTIRARSQSDQDPRGLPRNYPLRQAKHEILSPFQEIRTVFLLYLTH
jgi:hypothetical protein